MRGEGRVRSRRPGRVPTRAPGGKKHARPRRETRAGEEEEEEEEEVEEEASRGRRACMNSHPSSSAMTFLSLIIAS